MFPYLILGVALLAGLLLAGKWFTTADPRAIIKALKWLLFGIIGAIALFFIFTGRLAWAFVAVPALLPWFFRARHVHRVYKNFSRMAADGGPMTRVKALEVLGLEEGAGVEDIKDAHHRLIAGLHPDHGGSTYLAAQINRAKDVLLGD